MKRFLRIAGRVGLAAIGAGTVAVAPMPEQVIQAIQQSGGGDETQATIRAICAAIVAVTALFAKQPHTDSSSDSNSETTKE
jgi:hypothetical protein